MDIDLYYQTPYIKHKMNFTDVAFLYYNGIKDITLYNPDRDIIVGMYHFLYNTSLELKS